MAHAIGNKYLIPYDYYSIPDSLPSEFCDFEAIRQGAAAIVLEWGDRDAALHEEIDFAKKGIVNVLKTIHMLPGVTFVNKSPVYIYNETDINSNFNGILYILVDKGQYVTKGTLVGYTTDYWGKVIEEYYSPINGIIMALKVSYVINKDETVFRVAEVSDKLKDFK